MVKSDWLSVFVGGDCDSGTHIFTPIKRPYVISPVVKGIWPTPSMPKSPDGFRKSGLPVQNQKNYTNSRPATKDILMKVKKLACRIAWGATKKCHFNSTFQPQKSCISLKMIGFLPKPCGSSRSTTFLLRPSPAVGAREKIQHLPSTDIPRALSRRHCHDFVAKVFRLHHYHHTYRLSKHI